MSERGFSHKNKYSLILCKIFKKAVKDTIQHEKFNNHVTFYTPILRTGKQFLKKRKVIDTFSLIHYDLHLYNLHSIHLNKNMHGNSYKFKTTNMFFLVRLSLLNKIYKKTLIYPNVLVYIQKNVLQSR